MKEFKWQYSDEKILLKTKEHILSFVLSKFWVILSFCIFIILISFWLVYIKYTVVMIVLIIFALILIVLYFWFLYKDSFLYFTSRRVIKQIRNWLFFRHKKVLKILDIKWSMSNKKWFLQTILRIGNIKVEWTEKESNIYFKWIKEYEEISNYISRVVDYIKINWHTDHISKYQNKNKRQKLNN